MMTTNLARIVFAFLLVAPFLSNACNQIDLDTCVPQHACEPGQKPPPFKVSFNGPTSVEQEFFSSNSSHILVKSEIDPHDITTIFDRVLEYTWTVVSKPEDSQIDDNGIIPRCKPNARVQPDVYGTYAFNLTVCNFCCECSTETLEFTLFKPYHPEPKPFVPVKTNHPPHIVGSAKVVRSHRQGFLQAQVSACSTWDEDGDPVSYSFSLYSVPVHSSLSDADMWNSGDCKVIFDPDVSGEYYVGVTADDGYGGHSFQLIGVNIDMCHDSLKPDVKATVTSEEIDDLSSIFYLDGAGTTDKDSKLSALSYEWSIWTAPKASRRQDSDIQGRNSQAASFVPDVRGVYQLKLRVTDDCGNTGDTVVGLAVCKDKSYEKKCYSGRNTIPRANAGLNKDVSSEEAVALDGSDSYDRDNGDRNQLIYEWTLVDAPFGSDATSDDINARFSKVAHFAPVDSGTYKFSLKVCDVCGESKASTFVSAWSPDDWNSRPDCAYNVKPKADAGDDIHASTKDTVELSGSVSAHGTFSYLWTFIQVPEKSKLDDSQIEERTTLKPKFTPDAEGTFKLAFRASDGCHSDEDRLSVVISCDSTPTADAGSLLEAHNVFHFENLTAWIDPVAQPLDGRRSHDKETKASFLLYEWTILDVPEGSEVSTDDVQDANKALASFVPDKTGTYTAQLVVSDRCTTSTDRVQVKVSCDAPLTTNITSPADGSSMMSGANVTITGDVVGLNLTRISQKWVVTKAPKASALEGTELENNGTSAEPVQTLFTPDTTGDFEITLKATDPCQDTSSTIKITVGCSAAAITKTKRVSFYDTVNGKDSAGGNLTLGEDLQANEGDLATLNWEVVVEPAGSDSAAAINTTQLSNAFKASKQGVYRADLTYTDKCGRNGLYHEQIIVCDNSANCTETAICGANTAPDVSGVLTFLEGEPITETTIVDLIGLKDAEDDDLTYSWVVDSVPSGSSISTDELDGATTDTVTFAADVRGYYTLTATVSDQCLAETNVSITVLVTRVPAEQCSFAKKSKRPIVTPPTGLVGTSGSGVLLNITTTDSDDLSSIIYKWIVGSKPDGSAADLASFDDTKIEDATFTPDQAGDFVLQVEASDECTTTVASVEVAVAGRRRLVENRVARK